MDDILFYICDQCKSNIDTLLSQADYNQYDLKMIIALDKNTYIPPGYLGIYLCDECINNMSILDLAPGQVGFSCYAKPRKDGNV
jgi:hypothetical protein